jgi:hypothetical protein
MGTRYKSLAKDFDWQLRRLAPLQAQDAHIGLGPPTMPPIRTPPLGFWLGFIVCVRWFGIITIGAMILFTLGEAGSHGFIAPLT